MVYRDKHDRFLLCITPKCASEAWRDWFYNSQNNLPLNKLNSGINSKTNAIMRAQTLPPANVKSIPIIQVIRNPLSRLVSAYYDKIGNPKSTRYNPKYSTFNGWVEALYEDIDRISKWDNHWKPQYITPEGYTPTHYIDVSNMEPGVRFICGLIGRDPEFPPDKKTDKRRYQGDFIDQYTEETLEMARDIYAEDISIYETKTKHVRGDTECRTDSTDLVMDRVPVSYEEDIPGNGRRPKKSRKVITHITISPEGSKYHQHTAIGTELEDIQEYKDLLDIHSKNVLNADCLEDRKIRVESWYKSLSNHGTLICILDAEESLIPIYKGLLENSGFIIKSSRYKRGAIYIKAYKDSSLTTVSESSRRKGFLWTSPYGGCWPEKCFAQSGKEKAHSSKIKSVSMFKSVCNKADVELLIMGNFINDRNLIKKEAIKRGIDVIHGEDGFIPHYSTLHVDPIGFCWESSLSVMNFRGKLPIDHRRMANEVIDNAQAGIGNNPFNPAHKNILVPLQLLGDRVNRHGLNLKGWEGMLDHIRQALPEDVQMHIKKHPRAGQEVIASIKKWCRENANAHLYDGDINTALYHCDGAIGSNSTVLTEARLLYNRPTWAYGNSWYTNHTALVNRINLDLDPMELINVEHIEKGIPEDEYLSEYRLWYIGQLMARQHVRPKTKLEKDNFIKWMLRRTYNSYKEHGEDIFGLEGIPFR